MNKSSCLVNRDPKSNCFEHFSYYENSKKSKKLLKKEKKLREEQRLDGDEAPADVTLPTVSAEQFFEVKTSLKKVFEQKEPGFSLLSMFGGEGAGGKADGEDVLLTFLLFQHLAYRLFVRPSEEGDTRCMCFAGK